MKIDLSQFRDTFFQEASEHVNNMEASLLGLGDAPADPEVLNSIFRGAHSIKGGSGTFGFDDVTRFTHRLEELLDRMRAGKVNASPARIELLLRACDMLRTLLAAAEKGGIAPPEAATLIEDLAVAQRDGDFVAEAPSRMRTWDPKIKLGGQTAYSIHFVPSPDILREGMDPLLVLRELAELGTVEKITADLTNLPALSELQPDNCYLSWTIQITSEREREEIEDVFAFVENGAHITIEAQRPEGEITAIELPAKSGVAAAGGPAGRQRGRDSASIRVATGEGRRDYQLGGRTCDRAVHDGGDRRALHGRAFTGTASCAPRSEPQYTRTAGARDGGAYAASGNHLLAPAAHCP